MWYAGYGMPSACAQHLDSPGLSSSSECHCKHVSMKLSLSTCQQWVRLAVCLPALGLPDASSADRECLSHL